MDTNSNEKLPLFQYLGQTLRINFDETVKEVTSEDGETFTSYDYKTAVVGKSATYSDIVEAIVAIHYPTYGAELSAIRKGEEAALAHAEWVDKAKSLALDAVAFREHKE